MVVKDEVLERHPWIANEIYKAFVEAKGQWLQRWRAGENQTKEDVQYRELAKIVGDDPLPYGVEENLPTINALIDYAVQQKLMPKRLSVDELFVDTKA